MRIAIVIIMVLLSGCGFQTRGSLTHHSNLQKFTLRSPNTYHTFNRQLLDYFKMSPANAHSSIKHHFNLEIVNISKYQEFLSVNATQQTRQYKLIYNVKFQITNSKAQVIVEPENIREERIITIQANQMLGGSNEAELLYQLMQRGVINRLVNRLNSYDIQQRLVKPYEIKS